MALISMGDTHAVFSHGWRFNERKQRVACSRNFNHQGKSRCTRGPRSLPSAVKPGRPQTILKKPSIALLACWTTLLFSYSSQNGRLVRAMFQTYWAHRAPFQMFIHCLLRISASKFMSFIATIQKHVVVVWRKYLSIQPTLLATSPAGSRGGLLELPNQEKAQGGQSLLQWMPNTLYLINVTRHENVKKHYSLSVLGDSIHSGRNAAIPAWLIEPTRIEGASCS